MKLSSTILVGLIVILSLLVIPTNQKFVHRKFSSRKIQQNGFEYFTKFGINIGTGSYKAKFKLNRRINQTILAELEAGKKLTLDFMIILDSDYEEITNDMTCKEKYDRVKKSHEVILDTEGNWSEWVDSELSQSMRQHMWYFAVGNCDKSIQILEKYGFTIVAEIVMLNSDQSHFSSEESGMITMYGIVVLIFIGMLAFSIQKYLKMRTRDWPIIILQTSSVLLFLSVFFYFLHLTSYASDGEGSTFLRILSSLSNITSQVVLTILLVLLSWGWSINYMEMQNAEIMIPMVSLVAFINLLMMGLGYINDDDDYRYHQYDGYVGFIIILLRLGTFGYFIYSINQTLQTAREKVKEFIVQLQIWGSIYFLAIPIAVIIGSIFAYYLQNRIITVSTLIVQMSAIIYLSVLFMAKESGYQKVAMKNRTELPSAFDFFQKTNWVRYQSQISISQNPLYNPVRQPIVGENIYFDSAKNYFKENQNLHTRVYSHLKSTNTITQEGAKESLQKRQLKQTVLGERQSCVFDLNSDVRKNCEKSFRPSLKQCPEKNSASYDIDKRKMLKSVDFTKSQNYIRNPILFGDPKSEYNKVYRVKPENLPKNQFVM